MKIAQRKVTLKHTAEYSSLVDKWGRDLPWMSGLGYRLVVRKSVELVVGVQTVYMMSTSLDDGALKKAIEVGLRVFGEVFGDAVQLS